MTGMERWKLEWGDQLPKRLDIGRTRQAKMEVSGVALPGIAEQQSGTGSLVILAAGPALTGDTITLILEEVFERFVAHAYTAAGTKHPGGCNLDFHPCVYTLAMLSVLLTLGVTYRSLHITGRGLAPYVTC